MVQTPVLISVGTRPEIIKMAPVYAELRRRQVPTAWLHTGQHREMADPLYAFFGIRPSHELMLDRRGTCLAHLHAELLGKLSAAFEAAAPGAVLVHGDTTGTLASAEAAFYRGTPVGHVEAGLRTFRAREPFPEEKNRELTARLARWHFAPTAKAAANLASEGLAPGSIHTVGNTAIDSVLQAHARMGSMMTEGHRVLPEALEPLRDAGKRWRLITITAHRRENWGDGMRSIARAAASLLARHDDIAVLWPVHGNPAVRDIVHAALGTAVERSAGRLILCPPLEYPAMLWCIARSELLLTDSGGLQEEGAALRTPVLVLRETTERPELLEAGAGRLVGTEEGRVASTVSSLLLDRPALQRMRDAVNPFGDGHAALRIVDLLQQELGA